MDLKKLPPSMVLALGLACGDDGVEASTTSSGGTCLSLATEDVGPCLSPPEPETGACLSPCLNSTADWDTEGPGGTSTGGSGTSTGGSGTSTGGSGTSTGSDSGSDSGSDTDTGEATGTTGMGTMEAPSDRAEAVRRLLDRGALPADVAARLRAELPED